MTRVVLFSCAIAAVATAAIAQPPPAPRRYVAIGCLGVQPGAAGRGAAAPSAFILTDSRGETPLVYRLEGDAAALKPHVGHTIEVSGPLTPGSRTAKAPHAAAPLMKVQSVTWIAASCRQPKKN